MFEMVPCRGPSDFPLPPTIPFIAFIWRKPKVQSPPSVLSKWNECTQGTYDEGHPYEWYVTDTPSSFHFLRKFFSTILNYYDNYDFCSFDFGDKIDSLSMLGKRIEWGISCGDFSPEIQVVLFQCLEDFGREISRTWKLWHTGMFGSQ